MSLLEIKDLKVHFPIKRGVLIDRTIGHVQAVDGVSLRVEKGQTYGLVGESGCGKTTLGRAVLRLNQITDGEVWFGGRDLAGLDSESMRRERANLQMVFQDPLGSLNPRQTIGAILMEGLETHGIGGPEEFPEGTTAKDRRRLIKEDRQARVVDALERVGLSAKALKRYPHEFSGGQRQRIGIARALVLQPDLIICDEPVSALDVSIQAQILELLKDLVTEEGTALLMITHDLGVVAGLCDDINVLYAGRAVETAPREPLFADPTHPYTVGLLGSIPRLDAPRGEPLTPVRGSVNDNIAWADGCAFAPRCDHYTMECLQGPPPLVTMANGDGGGHVHRCVNPIEHAEVVDRAVLDSSTVAAEDEEERG